MYEAVLQELRNAKKRTHWMWFIFPRLHGLGHSVMSSHYGIKNIEEAAAYRDISCLGAD